MKVKLNLPIVLRIDNRNNFNAEIPNPPTDTQLQHTLQALIDYWNDGRKNFSVESINHHLTDLAREAVQAIVYDRHDQQFGAEIVELSPNSRMSRAYLETQNEMDTYRVAAQLEDVDCR